MKETRCSQMAQVYQDVLYTVLTAETTSSNEIDIQTLYEIFVYVLLRRKEWLMKMDFH